MPRSSSMMLSFPPFAGMVRKIILIMVGVYFVLQLLRWVAPAAGLLIFAEAALTPAMVTHGAVWQLLTYSFVSVGIFQTAFTLLSLWFIGSYLEVNYGTRWLTELYFVSVLGAAIAVVAISYTGIFHMTPNATAYGADGGIFGLLMAWAVRMGDQKFILFPLPLEIRAKYLVAVYILIALAGVVSGPAGFLYLAYLGGALAGYVYVKLSPRRGFAFAASERAFSVRNAYYRWKRRRAARKFEVYMRKHDGNGKQDGRGKYLDPDAGKDPADKRWMN